MRAFALVAFTFVLGAGIANASLIGDTVTYDYFYPAINDLCCGPEYSQLIAPTGSTLATNLGPGDIFSLISGNTIHITFSEAPDAVFHFNSVAFNGPVYSNLQWAGLPVGVDAVDLNTNMPGLNLSMISFGPNYIAVNFEGLNPGAQGAHSATTFVDLTIAPEPWNVLMTVSGLLGLGILRSRLSRVPPSRS